MKNKDLFTLKQGLEKAKAFKGTSFLHKVAINLKLVNAEIETLQESIKPTEGYTIFETKNKELVKSHAKVDSDTKEPVMKKEMINGQEMESYDIEDMKLYTSDFEALQAKYREVLDERGVVVAEYMKLLDEPTQVEIRTIKLELVPKDIDGDTMELIECMITDIED